MKDTICSYYKDYSKPLMSELLSILKMDKVYTKAERDYLYYQNNEDEDEKILDLAGGFGSLLLGHNNSELVDYIQELYALKPPFHSQLSVRSGSALLAKCINDIIMARSKKEYISTFLNSGTEAVEAALKHSYLNFRNKIRSFESDLEKAFVNIQNYHTKYGLKFGVSYDTRFYESFQSFKDEIIRLNTSSLNSNKQKILASKRSFHGKTLGALSITSNAALRDPFITGDDNRTLFFNWDENEVDRYITQNEFFLLLPKINTRGRVIVKRKVFNCITAIIIEPIIGEGGVHVVPFQFLKTLRQIATGNNIPLIFDEIQCGCYRTGEFLASFKANVYPDYYTIGKSLGGGLSKISALIIDKKEYIPEFEMIHSSTFAEDDVSSLIALKTLEIGGKQAQIIEDKSTYIFKYLGILKRKYEGIITDIRGDGLMIGISFRDYDLSQCGGLQCLSRSNYFGHVLAGYLLNKKNIRVSVTISDSRTIRIHPSLLISETAINDLISAIDELCYILKCSDFYSLIDYILPESVQNLRPIQDFELENIVLEDAFNCKSHVGFLVHFINAESVREAVPSLAILDDASIEHLTTLLMPFAHPVLLGRNGIENIQGEKVAISFVGLPFTSKMVKNAMGQGRRNLAEYQQLCNAGINFMYARGISKIGLGQFTSIILHNGKAIQNSNVQITTGNSFTVYSALEVIKSEISNRQSELIKVAIIGAGGNIAVVLSALLSGYCDSILLVGSSKNSKTKIIDHAVILIRDVLKRIISGNKTGTRLENAFAESNLLLAVQENNDLLYSPLLWDMYLDEFKSEKPIQITWNLERLKAFNVVVAATNQGGPFLTPSFFSAGTFICDISVPLNCTDSLLNSEDILVCRGGIVNLPNHEKLHPKGFPLKKGQAFACMAETLLMGFETNKKSFSFGELHKNEVTEIGMIGEKYGVSFNTSEHNIPLNV